MSRQQRFWKLLSTPTARLTGVHLAIIMLLSISFSVVFYNTSNRQFSRPVPQYGQNMPSRPDGFMNGGYADRFDTEVRETIDEYFTQTRQALFVRLIWLNIAALIIGGGISYLLARWSLRPIEEAMDGQIQFVSDASHELRTPLTVLQTTNEVALRKSSIPASEARKLISHNVDEVKKLKDLSNMLLDLLKNSNAPVVLADVNLQDVVSEAMSPVVAVAQQKNISIDDTVPKLYAKTNQALLARIVAILLDNAVKYSDNDKQVTVSTSQSGKKVFLHVTDNGIGIRATDLSLIFHRFYRADKSRSSVHNTHGYGLGLSIASKIAERLGARITVKSAVGNGSTFTVELPSQDSK